MIHMDRRSEVDNMLAKLSKKGKTLRQRQLLCCGVLTKNGKMAIEIVDEQRFQALERE